MSISATPVCPLQRIISKRGETESHADAQRESGAHSVNLSILIGNYSYALSCSHPIQELYLGHVIEKFYF